MIAVVRLVVAVLVLAASQPLLAQPAQTSQTLPAQLRVTVVDQTGGSIPTAHIRVTFPNAAPVQIAVDERGQATLPSLPAASVDLLVEAEGFAPFTRTIVLRRGNNNQTITLPIASLQEEVVVSDAVGGDTRGNSLTTTLEEEDIAELADDPDELREQLEAMTGGAGAVFQVDGFRGGRLPNRDEIRQIRFRMNSFSADNHDAGRVTVEIITRPGIAQWSGNANFGFRTDVLNARNAFAQTQTPEQFRRFNVGLRGPIVRNRTSLRLNLDGNHSFDSTTIVALLPTGPLLDQVKRPFDQTNVTFGIEHGFNTNHTMRLEYRHTDDTRTNLGVGETNLAERAFSRTSTEHQVRASGHSILGRSLFNELRFQWNRQESQSTSVSSEPAIVVIDVFSRGGAGVSSENATRDFEFADNLDFTLGKHALRAGVLVDVDSYRNLDARNAAGTFTFGSLDAFLSGTPDTYTQRLGQLRTEFSQYQLGLYLQDDFRVNRNLSLSLGMREELQTHVGDVINLMPRLGFTFAPVRGKTAIRGGYGIFHDWYSADLYDQTLRVTGELGGQRDLLVLNSGFPDPSGGIEAAVLGRGRVQADPNLRMPFVHQLSIGFERAVTNNLNTQASFLILRGRNQLRARDINAPDASGVRPEPNVGTVTQIEARGRSATERLSFNMVYRIPARRTFLSANYTWSNIRNDADGALSLPADSHNPDAEWGPSIQDVRHRFNAMFNFMLPLDLRAGFGGNAQSASPFTITTGRDDNRDGVSNDRPAGVGRNSARGSARWDMNARLSRSFGFGTGTGSGTGGAREQGGTGRGPDRIGVGGPDRGLGGGGFGGNESNSRFRVEFYLQAYNLLNRTNFMNYSGNLLSPFFGQPRSAAQARRVEAGMQFRF